jgi:hypothetical protein
MLTEKEMIAIAENRIKYLSKKTKIEAVIVHEETIRKKYGMIFEYTSKAWLEDPDNFSLAIAGNSPFLVEKETGNIVVFGTYANTQYFIDEYEAGRWK